MAKAKTVDDRLEKVETELRRVTKALLDLSEELEDSQDDEAFKAFQAAVNARRFVRNARNARDDGLAAPFRT